MKPTHLLAALVPLLAAAAPTVPAANTAEGGDARTATLKVTVKAGEEVLVRDHHNWTKMCKPEENPPVTIVRQPQSGKVEVRSGDFEAKRSLQGNEVCFGKVMPGNGVYYKAGSTPGTDSFRYRVVLGVKNNAKHPWEYEVEITVE